MISLAPGFVFHPGEFHDQPVRADGLDKRLLHPELVDPGPDDAFSALDRVDPALLGEGSVGIVDLEDQVDPALEIEAQLDTPSPQIAPGEADRRQNDDDPAAK